MGRRSVFNGFCVALLLCLIAVIPLEAATDLTQNLLSSRSSMVVHIKDFKKLHHQMPLPLRSIEKLMPTLSLLSDIVLSATLRVGLPRNFGKLEDPQKQEQPTIIAQFPMTIDLDMAAALELADEPLTSFELNIPEDINLHPIGQLNDLFLAKTELNGQVYLLIASTSELLLAMAKNDDQKEESRRLNDGTLWCSMVIDPRDLPDDQAESFSAPLRMEYDILTSEKELVAKIHVNTWEMGSHFFNNDPHTLKQALHVPKVAGDGPLHLLLSWNNSFIRSDLTLHDLLKQYSSLLTPEMTHHIEGAILNLQQFMDVQWSDLLDVLRGTITLGIIGSVESPWGPMPGFYLHLGGASEKLKIGLLESLKLLPTREPHMQGFHSIEGPSWKGFTTPDDAPMKASVLSTVEGLIITSMSPGQLFSGTPEPSTAMAAMTTAPAISSLGINIASLLPLTQQLWSQHGAEFLQSMEKQQNPVTIGNVEKFLNNLFQWSDLIITAKDAENGEFRFIVNDEPPVVKLETPAPTQSQPVCACDEAPRKTSRSSKNKKEVPQK